MATKAAVSAIGSPQTTGGGLNACSMPAIAPAKITPNNICAASCSAQFQSGLASPRSDAGGLANIQL